MLISEGKWLSTSKRLWIRTWNALADRMESLERSHGPCFTFPDRQMKVSLASEGLHWIREASWAAAGQAALWSFITTNSLWNCAIFHLNSSSFSVEPNVYWSAAKNSPQQMQHLLPFETRVAKKHSAQLFQFLLSVFLKINKTTYLSVIFKDLCLQ